jgi:hypothetical protein
MVDVMKRRERERVMTEIIQQIQAEKEALLQVEKRRSQEYVKDVEEILVDNQRKIEVSSSPYCLSHSLTVLSFEGIETKRVS